MYLLHPHEYLIVFVVTMHPPFGFERSSTVPDTHSSSSAGAAGAGELPEEPPDDPDGELGSSGSSAAGLLSSSGLTTGSGFGGWFGGRSTRASADLHFSSRLLMLPLSLVFPSKEIVGSAWIAQAETRYSKFVPSFYH